MKNIFNKFLISFSGLMVVALGMLGFKFQKENEEMEKLKEDLVASFTAAEKVEMMIEAQAAIEDNRNKKNEIVDQAVPTNKSVTSTKTVVIPGKTVKQTTTSSSKTTKSS